MHFVFENMLKGAASVRIGSAGLRDFDDAVRDYAQQAARLAVPMDEEFIRKVFAARLWGMAALALIFCSCVAVAVSIVAANEFLACIVGAIPVLLQVGVILVARRLP